MAADHILQVIQPQPGIQRDGTSYDSTYYIDGQWARFYRGKPKKVGGYILTDEGNGEIVRNMFEVPKKNSVDIYLGRPSTLTYVNITQDGLSSPEIDRTPAGFVASPYNQWTFDLYTLLNGSLFITLGANPITTTATSSTVQVAIANTGQLAVGSIVTIFGAAATGGIPAASLNITATITALVANTSFNYVAGAVATSSTTGGGGGVSYKIVTIALGANPITTTNGSATVVVSVTSTLGLALGTNVIISGATATGGISANNLNITAPITALVANTSFSYVAGASATSNATAGGAAVSYSTNAPVTYIVAVATQTVTDINNDVESLIYWGDVNAITPLVPISSSNQKTSGGIVVLYPYFFKYGKDGVVTFTLNPEGTWADAVSTALPVAGVKIVKGLRTRGGSNSPAGLFWSLDSLVRATFVGGALVFQYDNIQDNISVLSTNSIVTHNNVFYWIGTDQFYLYNGVVAELPNSMSSDWFFDNVNKDQLQKCWGIVCPRYKEIMWFYPRGDTTECSAMLFHKYDEQLWYDSVISRSSGLGPTSLYKYPLMSDAVRSVDPNIPNTSTTITLAANPITTNNGSSVVYLTVTSTVGIENGDTLSISGATATGGITAPQLNGNFAATVINSTTLSYMTGGLATSTATGGGNVVVLTYVSNLTYPIWTHEIGTDKVFYGRSLAIDSYFETNIFAFFDQNPQNDRQMRIRRIEQDFVQSGNMTLNFNSRHFAQGTVTTSTPYTFIPGAAPVELAKVDMVNMGRLVSLKFESNVAGGNYFMGKVLLSFAPGDVYP